MKAISQVDNTLKHFGILGMKWGVRRDPRMLTTKRQLSADKKVKGFLDKGGHTSVGFTKKRQAAYDARDKKVVSNRIAKNESRLETNKNKSLGRKTFEVGASVAVGVLASNVGGMAAYKLTGSLNGAQIVGTTLGIIGGKKYHDIISRE